MKIVAFDVRGDEERYLQKTARELGVELVTVPGSPTLGSLDVVEGCQGVSVLGQAKIDAPLLEAWRRLGVEYLSTRTVGFNHIDLRRARELGIRVCNASYAPNGVADFAVMLMLMCLRNYKMALWRSQSNDFSLAGLQGREMKDLTIGVLGTGRIGYAVIKNLSGFGCRILAHDAYRNDKVAQLAEYVDLETLYRESDVITLHTPFSLETYHMINVESLDHMKDGVIIINCARGELADPEALILGIESGKIGALGLDVVEGEQGIAHVDHRQDILANRSMAYLRQFPNVVMTHHFAFYTDAAVQSMARCGVEGIVTMARGETCPTELKG